MGQRVFYGSQGSVSDPILFIPLINTIGAVRPVDLEQVVDDTKLVSNRTNRKGIIRIFDFSCDTRTCRSELETTSRWYTFSNQQMAWNYLQTL